MKYDEFYLDMNERRSQPMILNMVKPRSVVLELGPYTGIMTNYMKNVLNCKVYICEFDEAAIAIARQYAEVAWQGDLETLEWVDKFKDIKFDAIIFADVLEHLKNPGNVLKATNQLLKDDGSVFVSIPNVAHNSVIYGLIHNKFEYAKFGILDATHLRFYTYDSAKKLCSDAGYTPVEETVTYEYFNPPISDDTRGMVMNKEYGNVLQFIFELKKAQYVKDNNITPVIKF